MTKENYKGVEIEIYPADIHSGANFEFIFRGEKYTAGEYMKNEDEAAGEAFRKIDELLTEDFIALDDSEEDKEG